MYPNIIKIERDLANLLRKQKGCSFLTESVVFKLGDVSCCAPASMAGGIKRWCASDVWRLSVAYIGPKSRTERPRKTKIGTEVAYVTRDSDFHFQGQNVIGQHEGAGHIMAASRTAYFNQLPRRHLNLNTTLYTLGRSPTSCHESWQKNDICSFRAMSVALTVSF